MRMPQCGTIRGGRTLCCDSGWSDKDMGDVRQPPPAQSDDGSFGRLVLTTAEEFDERLDPGRCGFQDVRRWRLHPVNQCVPHVSQLIEIHRIVLTQKAVVIQFATERNGTSTSPICRKRYFAEKLLQFNPSPNKLPDARGLITSRRAGATSPNIPVYLVS